MDLHNWQNWWRYVPGADWAHPEGPSSSVAGRELHPVTHVAFDDVLAYADWAGKQLATEAEWEFAARGGLDGALYAWGDEFSPRGRPMANTWIGEFPWQSLKPVGRQRTSPVRWYPPNGYGLYDVTGNVWEWTSDYYRPSHAGSVLGRRRRTDSRRRAGARVRAGRRRFMLRAGFGRRCVDRGSAVQSADRRR